MTQIRKRRIKTTCITHKRNQRAAEIQRQPLLIAHHLHCRRHRRIICSRKRRSQRRHRRLRMRGQGRRHLANQRRRQQRLVALHIDDDGVIRPAFLIGNLTQPLRTIGMIATRRHHLHRFTGKCGSNARIIMRDPYRETALHRLPRCAHHHRQSGNQTQRLAGQAGGSKTGGDNNDGVHKGVPGLKRESGIVPAARGEGCRMAPSGVIAGFASVSEGFCWRRCRQGLYIAPSTVALPCHPKCRQAV